MTAMLQDDTIPDGDNATARLDGFLDKMRTLGSTKGRGANAQIEAAKEAVEASAEGIIDVTKTEAVYDAFLGGELKAGTVTGTAIDDKKDRAQRVSELRQLVKMGAIKTIDPVKQIHEAIRVIGRAKLDGTLAKGIKVYSALVDVARAQCKMPEHEMSNDEMVAAAQPKSGRDKEEVDLYGEARAKLLKLEKEHGARPGLTEAIECLTEEIDGMGGTSAERRAAQKAAEALAKLQV